MFDTKRPLIAGGNFSLTVVVITRDRVDSLERCLAALADEVKAQDEVVVVSASARECDHEESLCQRNDARLVRTDLGNMPSQRNLGVERSHGDMIAFVDDDAFVQAGWRNAIIKPYADSGVGSVVGKEIREDDSHVRTGAAAGVTLWGGIRPLYDFESTTSCDVTIGQGCNMSFRRTVLESIGGFDPGYLQRANCEETDVFARLVKAGHRIVYVPDAVVLHVPDRPVGYTRSEFDRRSAFHLHRNRAYFFTKNYFGRLPFFMYLLRDTAFTGWIGLRRILVIILQTSAVFLLAVAGNVAGVWAGLKKRIG